MGNNNQTRIACRIKALRSERGITQKQLAAETGIGYGSIVDYENSRREPNSKAMAALERYFKVSGEYLRGESDERAPEFKGAPPKLVELTQDALSSSLNDLERKIRSCSDKEQKLFADILVELYHILNIGDERGREMSFSLFQDIFFAGTIFIDVCTSEGRYLEVRRMEKAKQSAIARCSRAFEDAFFFLSK